MVFFILKKKQIVFCVFYTIQTEEIKKSVIFTFFSDYEQIWDAGSVNHIIKKDSPDLDQL